MDADFGRGGRLYSLNQAPAAAGCSSFLAALIIITTAAAHSFVWQLVAGVTTLQNFSVDVNGIQYINRAEITATIAT